MKKNLLLVALTAVATLVASCSGGQSASTGSQPNQLPQGPVSYTQIQSMFTPPALNASLNTTKQLTSGGGGCGTVMSNSGAGAAAATGFVSFIPVVGPALGAIFGGIGSILTLTGGNRASACMQNEINQDMASVDTQFDLMQQQLYMQQQEINNIQTNLNLSSNAIWSQLQQNSQIAELSTYNTFNNQVKSVYGPSGYFAKIMQAAGVYEISTESITATTLTQLESNSALYNQDSLSSLYTTLYYYSMKTPGANALVQNISGTTFKIQPTHQNESYGAYTSVKADSGATYNTLLAYTYATLTESLPQYFNNESNVVQILDDYNNTLVSFYQQSVYAQQEIYFMAYFVNYLNYHNTVGGTLPDTLQVYGTYYSGASGNSVTAADTQAYNQAQKNLTLLFAAVINQTYSNTLAYIVTDPLVGAQSYPNNLHIPYVNESGNLVYSPETINYSALIGSKVSTAEALLFSGLENSNAANYSQYQALGNNLGSIPNLMIYQYGGIANIAKCVNSIESYTQSTTNPNLESALANQTLCPSVTSGDAVNWNNQSTFSNSTLIPYVAPNGSSQPVLTGSVTNNINLSVCNSSAVGNIPAWNMYVYTPSEEYPTLGVPGTSYLMCGNWSTNGLGADVGPLIETETGSSYYTYLLLSTSYPLNYVCKYGDGPSACFNTINNGWQYGEFFSLGGSLAPTNKYFYVMNTNDQTVWQLAPSNGYSTTSIEAGWLGNTASPANWCSNNNVYGRSYIAALQYTFGDGFIASFGIGISNFCGSNYANTVHLSINHNLLNVTMNGASLINQADILTNANSTPNSFFTANGAQLPYNSVNSNSVNSNNIGWYPVISADPNMQGYSALVINNTRIVVSGTTSSNNNSYATINIFPYAGEPYLNSTPNNGANCWGTGSNSSGSNWICTNARPGTTSLTPSY